MNTTGGFLYVYAKYTEKKKLSNSATNLLPKTFTDQNLNITNGEINERSRYPLSGVRIT